MANRSFQAGEVWRSDAQRDFLGYQLLSLARALLSTHFADESEESDYADWLQETSDRKGGAERMLLEERHDHPEQGTLRLTASPSENTFALHVTHADFAAEVTVTYDIDLSELDSGRIQRFRGDIAKAIEAARFWVDELTELDLDDLDLDDAEIDRMLQDGGSADPEDSPEEPPEDTPQDGREVRRMAHHLSDQAGDDGSPALDEEDRVWLENTPQSLWPILEGAVAAASAKERDDNLVAAYLMLLNEQLELIRYRSERGREWADDMLADYQDRLIQLAAEKTLEHHDLFQLVTALGHAKVAVKPELSEALMSSGPGLPDSMPPEQALNQAVRPLIDELASNVTSPFEVMAAMNETAAVMPMELRCFIAHELALSPHAVMREAVPLMLLDSSAEVRRAAALALDQTAAPDTLSPVSLRRAIALRNWIPEADRATLDQAVRKARTKGVQPAQWERASEHVIRASAVDGSGAQSVVFASKSGRSGLFAGLLLKSNFGVRDAWCSVDTPRREIASAIADLQRDMPAPEVERPYIEVAVQNAIAAGVTQGHPPDAAVLQIAEAVNGADWKDRLLDVAAEAEQLFGELPAEQRTAVAVTASLDRSLGWMKGSNLTDSWFEDDADVHDLLGTMRQQDPDVVSRALLEGLLAQRRSSWAERFLLTALWARAVKAGQPSPLGTGARTITWRDLLVLAREVLSDRPLREIPVMAEIAERTVLAARSGRW